MDNDGMVIQSVNIEQVRTDHRPGDVVQCAMGSRLGQFGEDTRWFNTVLNINMIHEPLVLIGEYADLGVCCGQTMISGEYIGGETSPELNLVRDYLEEVLLKTVMDADFVSPLEPEIAQREMLAMQLWDGWLRIEGRENGSINSKAEMRHRLMKIPYGVNGALARMSKQA
jgi:hypothetical protein